MVALLLFAVIHFFVMHFVIFYSYLHILCRKSINLILFSTFLKTFFRKKQSRAVAVALVTANSSTMEKVSYFDNSSEECMVT